MPYADVNGHRIHYYDTQELGSQIDNGKLPIVMVHGLGSSENYYLPVIPLLEDHRCVALTTYGAALSKSQGEQLSLEGLAEDVAGLLDTLKIPKAIAVGHSMGGPLVLQLAAAHPDKVAGVVAIGPVNPSSVKPEMFTSRIETVNKSESRFIAPLLRLAKTIANLRCRWNGAVSKCCSRCCHREEEHTLAESHDPRAHYPTRTKGLCLAL